MIPAAPTGRSRLRQPGRRAAATPVPPLYAPFSANYKFDPILPNVGVVYNFGGGFSVFASYARGFSAPRTDNLYRAPIVDRPPETTDAFDLGLRYSRRNVQAQATVWKINYSNRIVTSFNPDLRHFDRPQRRQGQTAGASTAASPGSRSRSSAC